MEEIEQAREALLSVLREEFYVVKVRNAKALKVFKAAKNYQRRIRQRMGFRSLDKAFDEYWTIYSEWKEYVYEHYFQFGGTPDNAMNGKVTDRALRSTKLNHGVNVGGVQGKARPVLKEFTDIIQNVFDHEQDFLALHYEYRELLTGDVRAPKMRFKALPEINSDEYIDMFLNNVSNEDVVRYYQDNQDISYFLYSQDGKKFLEEVYPDYSSVRNSIIDAEKATNLLIENQGHNTVSVFRRYNEIESNTLPSEFGRVVEHNQSLIGEWLVKRRIEESEG